LSITGGRLMVSRALKVGQWPVVSTCTLNSSLPRPVCEWGKERRKVTCVGDMWLHTYEIREREAKLTGKKYLSQFTTKNSNKIFNQIFTFIAQTSRNMFTHYTHLWAAGSPWRTSRRTRRAPVQWLDRSTCPPSWRWTARHTCFSTASTKRWRSVRKKGEIFCFVTNVHNCIYKPHTLCEENSKI